MALRKVSKYCFSSATHKPSVRTVVRWPRAVSSAGPGWGCGLPATLKADSPRNNATASIYLASRPSSSACCGAASFHTHTVASAENLYNTGQRRDSPDYPRCRRIRTIESGLRSRFHSVLFVFEVTFAQICSLQCRTSMMSSTGFSFSQLPVIYLYASYSS